MKYPAYQKYKRSGVEWLGDVPEHWEVKRLKFSARTIMGQSPSSEDCSYDSSERPFLQGNAEFDDRFPKPRLFCDVANKIVPVGSLLLSVRAPVGALNEADQEYGIGRGLCAVIPERNNLAKNFLWYLLLVTRIELTSRATGSTYEAVSADEVGDMLINLPSPAEQRSIADFLDAETTKLDTLVAKKQELIEKLKEKRTALISRTVTRGLPPEAARAAGLSMSVIPGKPEGCDPESRGDGKDWIPASAGMTDGVRFKPSGIEWLGEIPEHWEVVQLGRKIMLQRGIDITKDEQTDGTVPVVSSGGVSSFHDQPFAAGPGVIVGRKGTAGAVYYVETAFWPHDTTLWVKEFRGNDPRYVFYKLCAMDLASFDTGSANPTVNRNLVHPVTVSWPPVPEQRAIADYLDRETSKIDRMVEKVEAAIERLQEYRAALITAAVTGKIDVRNNRHSGGSRNPGLPNETGHRPRI